MILGTVTPLPSLSSGVVRASPADLCSFASSPRGDECSEGKTVAPWCFPVRIGVVRVRASQRDEPVRTAGLNAAFRVWPSAGLLCTVSRREEAP